MDLLPLFLTALITGFVHALEPDHMAAVTTFVSRRPGAAQAAGFGLRWGLGHSGAILVVGLALIAAGVRIPEAVEHGLEFGVGTLLLGLGLWLLWNLVHGTAHAAAGGEPGRPHVHRAGSLWVGVAHGLAGTAALLALLPVTLIRSPWTAGAYLLLFGLGTTIAMAVYAGVAGVVFQQAGRSPAVGGTLRAATALGSAVLGIFWMVNSFTA